MKISDALKYGQPVKRNGWSEYLALTETITLTPEDLIATDWEFKESAVNVTPTMFYRAHDEIVEELLDNYRYRDVRDVSELIMKLGNILGIVKVD